MPALELLKFVKTVCRQKVKGQSVEVKSAHVDGPTQLYDTLSSFSSQDSGCILLFRVYKMAGFRVVGVYDPQDLQKAVMEQGNQMKPRVIFSQKSIRICATSTRVALPMGMRMLLPLPLSRPAFTAQVTPSSAKAEMSA